MDAPVATEGAAVDVEALKEMEIAREGEEPTQAVGVGVLGWLGFIIVNIAAWGFITFASFVSWTFGLGVCVLYMGLLISLAVWLERRGPVYKQFVNLLWVLAGWFLFVSGSYIAVNALGDGFNAGNLAVSYPVYPFDFDADLSSLLPANASLALRQWGAERFSANNGPSFVSFGGFVFFNGRDAVGNVDSLRYTDGTSVNQVAQPQGFATNFRVFGSTLYFLSGSKFYSLAAANLGGNATSAQEISIAGGADDVVLEDLYTESSSPELYLKARLTCDALCPDTLYARSSVVSIFKIEDATASTAATDLRGDTCQLWAAQVTCPVGGGSTILPGPTQANLSGVIFLGAVPMLILSFYVLIKKQMPGLVFNIFGGVMAIVVMIYFLVNFGDNSAIGAGFTSFLKWFMLIYTSVCWKALVNWSLIVPVAAAWLEEVKTWSAAVLGMTFFVTIHFVLEVPFTEEVWRWVVYALLAVLQMVMSAVVQRTVPMVMGSLAAFVVAWKVGFEISAALNFGSREVQYLTTFAIIGLEGVGIILLAIAFAQNREKVQDWVRGLLCCAPCRKKTQPED